MREHDHDWVRDDDPFRREGLICSLCGMTEAEEAHYMDEEGA
jgi:hypothetical protein